MSKPDAYSYPRYLQSKKSVDDRALNQNVWSKFLEALSGQKTLRILEVGGGIGATVRRIVRVLEERSPETIRYTFVDLTPENVREAISSLRTWARERGYDVAESTEQTWTRRDLEVQINFVTADLFDVVTDHDGPPFDVVVGQAVLDLLPIPKAVRGLRSVLCEDGLLYLPLHFDGVTAFEPSIEPSLDADIERLYHESMSDAGQEGGREGAISGRRLLAHLQSRGDQIVAAGGSDWVVVPRDGAYPEDEEYFLHHILHFIEDELSGHPGLDAAAFDKWMDKRRQQVEHGELIYIAHQLDVFARACGS